jgi:hypothetical protein
MAAVDRVTWRRDLKEQMVRYGVFSERGYLEKYEDVANAVRNGRETDGLSHYLRLGSIRRTTRAHTPIWRSQLGPSEG